MFREKSVKMSLPGTKKVHGVEIKKVPLGRYIEVMKELEDLPMELFQACFPDMTVEQLLSSLSSANKDTMLSLSGRVMSRAPGAIVRLFCGLMDMTEERALAFTPAEYLDILTAFWAVNDLSGFFGKAWGLVQKRIPTRNTGFKSGSPSPKA